MTSPDSRSTDSSDVGVDSSVTRTVLTLLLVVHLFCVLVALSSNLGGSLLQMRLRQRLLPYLQTLGLELDYKPYHWTHATENDVDQRIEVTLGEDPEWRLVARGWRGSERHRRYRRLAAVLSYHAGDETLKAHTAEIARGVAEYYAAQEHADIRRLRAMKRMLVDWQTLRFSDELPDLNNENYINIPYDAYVILDAQGNAAVTPIDSASETARPVDRETEEPAESAGTEQEAPTDE